MTQNPNKKRKINDMSGSTYMKALNNLFTQNKDLIRANCQLRLENRKLMGTIDTLTRRNHKDKEIITQLMDLIHDTQDNHDHTNNICGDGGGSSDMEIENSDISEEDVSIQHSIANTQHIDVSKHDDTNSASNRKKLNKRKQNKSNRRRVNTRPSKRFQCTECGKYWNSNWDLTRHRRTHSGEKPFQCTTCLRRFSDKSSCNRHMISKCCTRKSSHKTCPSPQETDASDETTNDKQKEAEVAPVILCTKLSTDQIKQYDTFKDKFGHIVTFTSQWKPNVTHLVTSATSEGNEKILSARTIKYFQSVIAGCWVMCFDWIEECLCRNTLIEESSYEVLGDLKGRGGARKSRQLRKKKSDNGLFSNVICVVASEFKFARLDEDLRGMFRMGGAKMYNMLPYHWSKDRDGYKKEVNGKNAVFVYDPQNYDMTQKQIDFCNTFGVLPIGYQQVFDTISNYKPISHRILNA
eukprot:222936_1